MSKAHQNRASNVRSWGKTGRDLLVLSISQVDPQRTLANAPERLRGPFCVAVREQRAMINRRGRWRLGQRFADRRVQLPARFSAPSRIARPADWRFAYNARSAIGRVRGGVVPEPLPPRCERDLRQHYL